ncbi:AAA family ATPase [Halanaerobium congolense]|jgi:SpoVK/Ycf46/Vps4 family AAA+-type ATPase|uniref:ATPase family associated with various cellular activities (AAA) n=1 Tax=Halanaerobium congolense TaxID=54121 RepID=A0A1G6N8J7_9FIRM|nr:ATP-binding protein [Halanaerobium congolense]TDX36426.1 ATPase family protein associated with various cellular activities (AAA) [Halanaerobium congolense]SDC64170.1 ATPase family associated with various cellular activities (AAA) [Halanaerobium congolense]
MPKGEFVKDLLKAFNKNDYQAFKKVAEKIVEDEKSKSHNNLANSLQKVINSFDENNSPLTNYSNTSTDNYFVNFPRDQKDGSDLISIINPKNYLEDVILSEENEQVINRVLNEYFSANKLKRYNIDAKRRLLFCGPPGCGKTLTAKAIAKELNLPLLYIHMDSLISSYLGETASNLRKIFKYASQDKWVIFFDEFDTIAKNRDDKNEHGELKRSVNTFLQMLDNFKINTLLIAATNHQHLLDNAIWRRFDEIMFFDKPDKNKIKETIRKKVNIFKSDLDLDKIAGKFIGMSYAEIERIAKEAMRYCILNDKSVLTNNILLNSLKDEKRRKRVYAKINSQG